MKPNDQTRTVESTLAGDEVKMGIDPGALAHIMRVLTDLYSDPEAAVIREYATNARDAHIEAGFAGPVEVTTPSDADAPLRHGDATLTIRDYGVGLDREGIRTIYSQYGASTKRGTDDQVGMLGLGCKSALTYADQFTLVGIKDGVRTTVAVSRDAEGAGGMQLLSEDATDEANGVTVQIPAKQHNALLAKALDFFGYWPEGSVLLNGAEPEPHEGFTLTDDLTIQTGDDTQDVIVMGGVAYPTDFELWTERGHRYDYEPRRLIARVEIGAVDFAPSREALMDTAKTRATIDKIKADFKQAAEVEVGKRVKSAGNKGEALEILADSIHALGVAWPQVTYKGDVVPQHIELPGNTGAQAEGTETLVLAPSAYRLSAASAPDKIDTREARHAIWVRNFAPVKLTAAQRRKLDGYRDHTGANPSAQFILLRSGSLPNEDWLDGVTVWEWGDLRKWRDPNATNPQTGRKIAGKYYTLREKDDRGWPDESQATDLAKMDSGLVYVQGTRDWGYGDQWSTGPWPLLMAKWPSEAGKFTLAIVPQTRIAKFKRDLPHAVSLDEFEQSLRFREWDKLTDAQKKARAWQEVRIDNLDELDSDKLDDPELIELLRVSRLRRDAPATAQDDTLPEVDPYETLSAEEVHDRYPLLARVELRGTGVHKRLEALHFYLNAAYRAGKEDA